MRKSLERRLLVTSVYAGVVLLLALLALFFRGFSESVGDARVSGSYAALPVLRPRTLQNLTVSWNGLALRFARGSTPSLQGIETTDAGADIIFDGNVRLRLAPGGDVGGSVSISAVASAGGSGTPFLIPFSVPGALSSDTDSHALSWNRAGVTYSLSLPSGARADADTRVISLPLGAGALSLKTAGIRSAAAQTRVAVLAPVRAPARAPAAKLPDEKSMPTQDQMQAAVSRYLDVAYAGWTGSRFSGSDGTWKAREGSAQFSEEIGMALVAESLQRGTSAQILPLWADAFSRNQRGVPDGQLTFSTSPFIGGLPDFLKRSQVRAAALVQQASSLLSKSDNALLAIPGLVLLLENHSSHDLLQQALTFITGRNVAALDPVQAVGLLEALVDVTKDEPAGSASSPSPALAKLRELVDMKILPAVRTIDAGVFLESAAGRVDVKQSVRCGALLLQAGGLLQHSLAAAAGRGLIVSALHLAEDDGWLPATLTLSAGRVGERAGSVAPESVYPFLPAGRYLPREVSLARLLGPGAWMWGAAPMVSAESSAVQTKLVLAFPAGVAHNFLIQGVPQFKQIQLHGIPWHTDPTYFKYSDGWAYDGASRTLYFKLTGRQANEEIDIFY
jgi:hypothetical protein